MLRTAIRIGTFIATFLSGTTAALAQPAAGQGAVSGPLSAGPGEFGAIAFSIATSFRPVVTGAAILAMVISGFFLTLLGNESQVGTAKRVVIASLAAIVLVNVAPAIYNAYISANPAPIGAEILGFLSFIEVPLGVAAVVMIIISGIKAILAYGSEEGVTQLRRTVIYVIAGCILIAAKLTIAQSVAGGTPDPLIGIAISIMNSITGIILVIALAVIIYAAFLMLANIGNDDQYGKARSLLVRVAIGMVIIAVSAGIINFVVAAT